ncbi:MAG: hypothetical protein RBG13Loki_3636 [Promethearchaeota archaeon CR_4]|nr:MAG: hypothetical protein RBG13Loki_3636 [Candidatus Lokiarchaeota archaeon CR_4]
MSTFSLETHILIHLPSQEIAEQYFTSLAPELRNSPKGRAITKYNLPHDGNLEFTIIAQDFAAARAAYNSIINYLKVIDTAYNLPKSKV